MGQTQKDLLLCTLCRDNVNLWVDFYIFQLNLIKLLENTTHAKFAGVVN